MLHFSFVGCVVDLCRREPMSNRALGGAVRWSVAVRNPKKTCAGGPASGERYRIVRAEQPRRGSSLRMPTSRPSLSRRPGRQARREETGVGRGSVPGSVELVAPPSTICRGGLRARATKRRLAANKQRARGEGPAAAGPSVRETLGQLDPCHALAVSDDIAAGDLRCVGQRCLELLILNPGGDDLG